MKTAEEKVTELLKDYFGDSSIYREGLTLKITKLLKEQDRDTRHACAEAVEACMVEGLLNPQKACAACINVKAV